MEYSVDFRHKYQLFREHAVQERDRRRLQKIVARIFRGHLYGRKLARHLRAQRDARSWGPTEWGVSELVRRAQHQDMG